MGQVQLIAVEGASLEAVLEALRGLQVIGHASTGREHALALLEGMQTPTLEARDESGAPVAVEMIGEPEAPASQELPHWQRTLAELGGSLDFERRVALPPAIAKSAPVLEVLNSAGEWAATRIGDEDYGVYGWPDLRRPDAKVLLVGTGEPFGEILVLHRMPTRIGVCRRGGGLLYSSGRMGRTSEEVTGHDYPESGRLFAVDSDRVYVVQGQTVSVWDGTRATAMGSPASVMASLLLQWSQR